MIFTKLLITILIVYIIIILLLHLRYPELRWNWKNINTDKIKFDSEFMWGTATAAHQVEGNCTNNWSEFEKNKKLNGEPNIKDNQFSGRACEHWERYKEDIKLIKNTGVSYYRFSIEWSKIQPELDIFDNDAIKHYSDMINILIDNKITPVLTLHHFTHPIWFDRIGGFEKEENIKLFVNFCKKVFLEYSNRVKYWCTINEPAVVATQGYFTGIFPPGKTNSQLSAIVLKNLLEAHVRVYRLLKDMNNGSDTRIGLVKNINQFDPMRRWNILDWFICYFTNQFFNYSSVNFIHTGKFKIKIPGLAWINHKNKNAINSIDFFGLNYYSHNHIKFKFSFREPFTLEFRKNDIKTDMPYTIYGEGIYRAIKRVSKLNVPIIITENGIADTEDKNRELYINRYLYAVSKAIKDGYNVIGYYYWSLMDNFEWAFGYDMKFGLYSVNFKTQERKLRDGAKAFIRIVKNGK